MIMLFVRQSNNREALSGTSSILTLVFFDFLLTVNAVPNECVIRTCQPYIGKSKKRGVVLFKSNCIILRHYLSIDAKNII